MIDCTAWHQFTDNQCTQTCDVYTYLQLPSPQVCYPQTDDLLNNRKEVTFIKHIQETSSWDMSELVLDLDTKTAELSILQSLLEQNENELRV